MPASPVDRMVAQVARQVRDPRVLQAMRTVPRERFVPERLRDAAYDDRALPIGGGQTISQPTIVGIMVEALALTGEERVLEIGTGSGYQAAILAQLAAEVVTVEVVDELREQAERTLAALGIERVRVLAATEEIGARELAPFDAIVVAAAAPAVPEPLIAQLRDRGRLAIPVGTRAEQELLVVTRRGKETETVRLGGCRFVPLVGRHGFEPTPAPDRNAPQ